MDTVTAFQFSRNRVLDFLRPATAGGGVSEDGRQTTDEGQQRTGDEKYLRFQGRLPPFRGRIKVSPVRLGEFLQGQTTA